MSIVENLQSIQQRIAAACDRSGRDPKEVQLIAVSKGHSAANIREAADAGLTLFGENKVQELKLKRGQCPGNLRWEFIGHLQTNKCRDAAYFSNMIHSVDSERVAEAL
ncbi:MAG: YggS family pyridoxal phosphate-dependent enzyme, partial [Verrucomicrobia bacterium]|nr:YggS family pyridoxal phosphate-dependent enzyme [Verrucomicrobiota bacterium]